ncbi:MAG: hypothetical protein JWL84_112 [Rhodospirillales bacterium]|nr:hypothetical protein [Rhodospirillales bacterium]
MRHFRAALLLIAIVILAVAAPSIVGAQSPGTGSCYGNDSPIGLVRFIGIVTGTCTPVSQTAPLPVGPPMGTPADASVNQQTIGGLNLLATVAPSTSRAGGYWIMNESAATITVVLDDGAGNASTQYLIGPGAGANQQGGSIDSSTGLFQGRIRVYGIAGSNVAVRTW